MPKSAIIGGSKSNVEEGLNKRDTGSDGMTVARLMPIVRLKPIAGLEPIDGLKPIDGAKSQ